MFHASPARRGAAGPYWRHDILGVNYHWNNQRLNQDEREAVLPFEPGHRPLRDLLTAAHARYNRPIFLAETRIEGDARAPWLRYIREEVRVVLEAGAPIEGICLYPVLSHPGWDDDRYCPNGLFELTWDGGGRLVDAPLTAKLREQQRLFRIHFNGREGWRAYQGTPRPVSINRCSHAPA
jgi:hypothetical protein